MDKIIIVFVSGVGLMIGKPDIENIDVLKDPRIIVVNQQENKIKLVPFIGNPEEFNIGNSPYSYYEVKDQNVINKYIESISNITMATTIPSGPTLVK
jgi:hypothetical protein